MSHNDNGDSDSDHSREPGAQTAPRTEPDDNGSDRDGAADRGRRKEKVLHARISDTLDEEIRDRAERLGISVSNLVRNVLENTLGVVDDIVADTSRVARSARDAVRGEPVKPRQPAKTLGWQELTLSVNAVCARCNDILPKGARAAVEVKDRDAPREIRCTDCAGSEQ